MCDEHRLSFATRCYRWIILGPCSLRLLCVLIVIVSSFGNHNAVAESDAPPFDYNPILDARPTSPQRERVVEWTQASSGFRIGTYAGVSFGSAASYLSPRISSLDLGTFPLFGLSLGVRLGTDQAEGLLRRFELSINGALGFGRTFEKGDYDNALDIHLRPSITYHFAEGQRWATSLSASLNTIIFDSEDGEVSQLAVGPSIAPRLTWKMSDLSQIYIEVHWSPIYDFLAYSFRDPTEEESENKPELVEIKEKGQWFNHYQALIGLRLLGF